MKLHIGLILFCAVICVVASDRDREEMKDLTKFDFIATKLHNMEVKLQNMEVKLQNIEENQRKVDNMELLLQKIEKQINGHRSTQEQSISNLQKEVLGALQNQDTRASRNYNALQNQIQGALNKIDQEVGRVQQKNSSNLKPIFFSCKDVPSNVSRPYWIRVIRKDGVSVPFEVYCEQKAFGGGWIVIQHRFNGSLDFYRGWNEFRDGFGDFDKEFWLGLEKVHQLTNARSHELIVELKDFNGTYTYARYNAFKIGSESGGYVLNRIGSHRGTAVDGMRLSRNEKFSTKDRDNDQSVGQCAHEHEGAWWHFGGVTNVEATNGICTGANLNGRYRNAVDSKSMFWFYSKKNEQGFSFSRIMIREV